MRYLVILVLAAVLFWPSPEEESVYADPGRDMLQKIENLQSSLDGALAEKESQRDEIRRLGEIIAAKQDTINQLISNQRDDAEEPYIPDSMVDGGKPTPRKSAPSRKSRGSCSSGGFFRNWGPLNSR